MRKLNRRQRILFRLARVEQRVAACYNRVRLPDEFFDSTMDKLSLSPGGVQLPLVSLTVFDPWPHGKKRRVYPVNGKPIVITMEGVIR